MLIKQESITSQKLGSGNLWQIANSVLKKDNSALPPLINGPEVLSSGPDKAKIVLKFFSKNSNLNESGISLLTFPSRTNLKLHNIHVTPKFVMKILTNFDLSSVYSWLYSSGGSEELESELSYILDELFDMCLKESCFPDC